jgi:RHS repeat-associated protein
MGESGTPSHLQISSRSGNGPALYQATELIEFVGEFQSGAGDEFTAEIGSGSGDSGSGTASGVAGSGYRYGFNGKENDNEVKGEGAQQDYGMRIFDPRVGKFLSVDPLTKSFAWFSPYQFAGNTPIAAIDLDGEEQRIMINWKDVNGNVGRTKLVKHDFTNTNKFWQSIKNGLSNETTYTLEGTKFNATNAQFTSGFEAYKKGSGARTTFVRPNNGTLTFDISTDAKGGQSVKIGFDNAPINEKELYADALRRLGKAANFVGNRIEEAGYVVTAKPGLQEVGIPMIVFGKGVSAGGDVADIGADLLQGKKEDVLIKGGAAAVGLLAGKGIEKIPIKKIGTEAIDTYVGRGAGAIKDGYFNNRRSKVEESDKIDLKIETINTNKK